MKDVTWPLKTKILFVVLQLLIQVVMWGLIGLVAGWWGLDSFTQLILSATHG